MSHFHDCSPCQPEGENTPANETLASQISNFSLQFFGEVVKTEVDGQVVWSLPCSLDVGLPSNPRGDSEGLACYFLRLFNDGITGLVGPKGEQGTAGTNGRNAYTVVLRNFTTPTLNSPIVQVLTAPNPVMVGGVSVFIAGSGWYKILQSFADGTLILQLYGLIGPGTVQAGSLVIPTGEPGKDGVTGSQGIQGPSGPQGIQGPKGTQGIQGPQGPAGSGLGASEYGFISGESLGTTDPHWDDLSATEDTYANLNFGTGDLGFVAATAGVYAVNVIVVVVFNCDGTQNYNQVAYAKLTNSTAAADITNSEQKIQLFADSTNNSTSVIQLVLNTLVTTMADAQTIVVKVKGTAASIARYNACQYLSRSCLTYVKIA